MEITLNFFSAMSLEYRGGAPGFLLPPPAKKNKKIKLESPAVHFTRGLNLAIQGARIDLAFLLALGVIHVRIADIMRKQFSRENPVVGLF